MKSESGHNLTDIKKIHGMYPVIASKIGVSKQYVHMILAGRRDAKSKKASEVVRMAQEISSVIK